MANTENFTIDKSEGWKLIKTGPSKGVMSAGIDYSFCESDTPPSETLRGHNITEPQLINYDVLAGQNLYVKATNYRVFLTLTED